MTVPEEVDFANTLKDYYINFLYDLQPGSKLSICSLILLLVLRGVSDSWPRYTLTGKEVLQLMKDDLKVIQDGTC